MPTPAELISQGLAKLASANRIDGNKNSYRKDNPNEYTLVMAYLAGGVRPNADLRDGRRADSGRGRASCIGWDVTRTGTRT